MELIILTVFGAIIWVIGVSISRARNREVQQNIETQVAQVTENINRLAQTAQFRVLDPVDYDYKPVGNELLVAVHDNVSRIELKNTGRYARTGFTYSIRIAKGLSYRIGNPKVTAEKAWQVTATGRLLVTTRALVFESPQKNERLTWVNVADVKPTPDGVDICRRNGASRSYQFGYFDPEFMALLLLGHHSNGFQNMRPADDPDADPSDLLVESDSSMERFIALDDSH